MKIYVEQRDLQNAIEKVEKVIRKTSVQVLDSVLLEAKGKDITLTTYNLVSSITVPVWGEVVENGNILIDKSNFRLIKKLQGRLEITDDKSTDKDTITIKGNRQLKSSELLPSEYPEVPIETNKEAFTIAENEFLNSLKIKALASKDDTRPVLNGCTIKGDKLVTLDGFRMGVVTLNIHNLSDREFIIPLESIDELNKILDKKSNKELKFSYMEETPKNSKETRVTRLKITGEDFTFVTRLIDGDFVKFEQIIPTKSTTSVRLNRKALLESLEFTIEIVKDLKNKQIVLNITDELAVTADNGSGKQSKESIDSEISGKEITIGFNNKYFIEILKLMTDDEIVLEFTRDINSMLITGTETDNGQYILLPIRLVK